MSRTLAITGLLSIYLFALWRVPRTLSFGPEGPISNQPGAGARQESAIGSAAIGSVRSSAAEQSVDRDIVDSAVRPTQVTGEFVTPNGDPVVANAILFVDRAQRGRIQGTSRFTVPCRMEGTGIIEILVAGSGIHRFTEAAVLPSGVRTDEATIDLGTIVVGDGRAGTIVHVTDADGPVRGAEICSRRAAGLDADRPVVLATTDADGEAEIRFLSRGVIWATSGDGRVSVPQTVLPTDETVVLEVERNPASLVLAVEGESEALSGESVDLSIVDGDRGRVVDLRTRIGEVVAAEVDVGRYSIRCRSPGIQLLGPWSRQGVSDDERIEFLLTSGVNRVTVRVLSLPRWRIRLAVQGEAAEPPDELLGSFECLLTRRGVRIARRADELRLGAVETEAAGRRLYDGVVADISRIESLPDAIRAELRIVLEGFQPIAFGHERLIASTRLFAELVPVGDLGAGRMQVLDWQRRPIELRVRAEDRSGRTVHASRGPTGSVPILPYSEGGLRWFADVGERETGGTAAVRLFEVVEGDERSLVARESGSLVVRCPLEVDASNLFVVSSHVPGVRLWRAGWSCPRVNVSCISISCP